jgi:Histidine-specific methyltransferase, SAM-dependent
MAGVAGNLPTVQKMSALVQPYADLADNLSHDITVRNEFEFTVARLLSAVTTGKCLYANPYTNLAPFMYVEDSDDHRWKDGHSGHYYYLGRDDKATHQIAMNDPTFDGVRVQNYFEMGPGGREAVLGVSEPAGKKFQANNWYFFDRSDSLAIGAADLVQKRLGVNALPVICDFFEKLPIVKSNTLITISGGTIQNVETHTSPETLQRRVKQIFSHYLYAVSDARKDGCARNHLILGFDANQNDREILACYENEQFGGLVCGLIQRAFDITDLDYHVTLKRISGIGFLSTGLRATRKLTIEFDGRKFPLEPDQFIPVLNSYRLPVSFMTEAITQAGWTLNKTWTATGRSHYQHYT